MMAEGFVSAGALIAARQASDLPLEPAAVGVPYIAPALRADVTPFAPAPLPVPSRQDQWQRAEELLGQAKQGVQAALAELRGPWPTPEGETYAHALAAQYDAWMAAYLEVQRVADVERRSKLPPDSQVGWVWREIAPGEHRWVWDPPGFWAHHATRQLVPGTQTSAPPSQLAGWVWSPTEPVFPPLAPPAPPAPQLPPPPTSTLQILPRSEVTVETMMLESPPPAIAPPVVALLPPSDAPAPIAAAPTAPPATSPTAVVPVVAPGADSNAAPPAAAAGPGGEAPARRVGPLVLVGVGALALLGALVWAARR